MSMLVWGDLSNGFTLAMVFCYDCLEGADTSLGPVLASQANRCECVVCEYVCVCECVCVWMWVCFNACCFFCEYNNQINNLYE